MHIADSPDKCDETAQPWEGHHEEHGHRRSAGALMMAQAMTAQRALDGKTMNIMEFDKLQGTTMSLVAARQ